MKKRVMRASELVALLQKRISEYGDLEIFVNTQEGSAYQLYGEDSVMLQIGRRQSDGAEISWLEIG